MTTQVESQTIVREFGAGRYSALMRECYTDAQRIFNLTEEASFRLAQAIGRDYGAVMKSGEIVGKIGKINTEQRCTLSEACKVKNVYATNALRIMRAMQWANECKANGVSRDSKLQLLSELQEYVDSL